MAYKSKYTGAEIEQKLDAIATPPTKLSDLDNDKGFLTSADITDKADKKYVDDKVAGVVDSAPEALNTLQELATALGNNPNFATTVAEEIGSKVSKTDYAADKATFLTKHQDISGKVDKIDGKSLSTNDYTTADKEKLDAMQRFTIGEGLVVENGVLKCSFTPTRYYTGSSEPEASAGNNGDLYLLIGNE